MIASKESFEPHSSEQLPNSSRVYIEGQIHRDIRVPMREIALSPTKAFNGKIEENAPVRVYDCSGPWGDPEFHGNSEEGLPALRETWIMNRGDVAAYDGREVKPQDNGYLSGKHAEFASTAERNRLVEFPGLHGERRRPLKASAGHPVTQLWYAKQGIITPEMEYIAIRENMKIADCGLQIGRKTSSAAISTSSTLAPRRFKATTRLQSSSASPSASRRKSRRNLSEKKSPVVAPSFPRTSTTPSWSR